MMIGQLQKESDKDYREGIEVSQSIERSRIAKEQQERDQLRLEQEQEYEESVTQDLVEETLSLETLRQKRLDYYQ